MVDAGARHSPCQQGADPVKQTALLGTPGKIPLMAAIPAGAFFQVADIEIKYIPYYIHSINPLFTLVSLLKISIQESNYLSLQNRLIKEK